MGYRVGTSMKTTHHKNYLRELEVKKQQLQSKISGEEKHLSLAENPSASALSSKYRSDLNRINSYMTNIDRIKGENQFLHNQLQEVSSMMIRVKELTVQASNGIYGRDELANSAVELDQMIQFMIDIGNLKDENGNAYFAGTQKISNAFESYMGRVPGSAKPLLVKVDYVGNHYSNEVAIDEGKTLEIERSGSRIFWGSNETIYGANEGGNYRVLQDSVVYVNGQEISLKAGDNIHSIVARINAAVVSVTAEVDPDNHFVIRGNRKEQLFLQDGENSTVFQDLGLIIDGQTPPYNISPYAQKEGDNLFNQLISVRNMMLKGDIDSLGSRGLRSVEMAHASVVHTLSSLGAQTARLDAMSDALASRELNLSQSNVEESVVTDVDRAEMLMRYQELDQVHTATLKSASKALSPSLLDFLR